MKDEDVIEHLLVASTHDTVLLFSNRGKVYWLKVYEMPNASRGSRGKPLVNMLPLEEGESVNAILPVRDYDPSTTFSSPPQMVRLNVPALSSSLARVALA